MRKRETMPHAENNIKDIHLAAVFADTFLSVLHHSIYTSILPFHADMLGICKAGIGETWSCKGTRTCDMAYPEMQPMGRQRV